MRSRSRQRAVAAPPSRKSGCVCGLRERRRAARRDADRAVGVGEHLAALCRRCAVGDDDEPADGGRRAVVPGRLVEDAIGGRAGVEAVDHLGADDRARRPGRERRRRRVERARRRGAARSIAALIAAPASATSSTADVPITRSERGQRRASSGSASRRCATAARAQSARRRTETCGRRTGSRARAPSHPATTARAGRRRRWPHRSARQHEALVTCAEERGAELERAAHDQRDPDDDRQRADRDSRPRDGDHAGGDPTRRAIARQPRPATSGRAPARRHRSGSTRRPTSQSSADSDRDGSAVSTPPSTTQAVPSTSIAHQGR